MPAVTEPPDVLTEPTALSRRLNAGRIALLFNCALVVLLSAATIVLFLIYVGPAKLPQQLVRFVLTCLLMWWLWRGSPVARWTAVVLLGSGGLLSALLVVSGGAPTPFAWLLAIMQSAYLPFAVLLALRTPVSDFVKFQRLVRDMQAAAAPR